MNSRRPRRNSVRYPVNADLNGDATQLCPNRIHGAKGKRRDCRCWIRGRTGRKDAAAKDEEILVIVRSALLVDHRVGLVITHARCPHDMTRAAERERLGVIIELQFAASDAHGVEDSLMHLDDFLETLAHIVVIAVDRISDERSFQLQLVEIGRFRNAVFLDWQLLARAIERDLPDRVVTELLAQLIAEETPILNEIEQRAGMPILGFLLSGNACAARGAGSVSRPAIVLDRCLEGGKLPPKPRVAKVFDL